MGKPDLKVLKEPGQSTRFSLFALTFGPAQIVEHFVGRGYNPAARKKCPLGDDHVREFCAESTGEFSGAPNAMMLVPPDLAFRRTKKRELWDRYRSCWSARRYC